MMNSNVKRFLAMLLAILLCVPVATQSVYAEEEKNKVTITENAEQSTYTVAIENVTEQITGVYVPVWSTANGQDDICWYLGTEKTSGVWEATVSLANHNYASGKYEAHVYGILPDGSLKILRGTSFLVKGMTAGKLTSEVVDANKGLYRLTLKDVYSPAGIARVSIPVWTNANGQDDLVWHEAYRSNGAWVVDLDVRKHNYETGKYTAHAYAFDNRGASCLAGNTTFNATAVKRNILNCVVNADQTQATITLSNTILPAGMSSVMIPVWGNAAGQNDIVWYTATALDAQTYQVVVPISSHMETGKYSVHVYALGATMQMVTNGSFNIEGVSANAAIVDVDDANGYFSVEISDVTAPGGVESIKVPVWTEADGQDDIVWYDAQKDGDKWIVKVDIGDHQLQAGKYNVHVYIKDSRGFQSIIKTDGVNISASGLEPKITADVQIDNAVVELTVVNILGANGVYVPVWGNAGGQNDINWYNASKLNARTWKVTVPLWQHNETGAYQAHVYSVSNNAMTFETNTTFNVDEIRVNAIAITDKDPESGKFTVEVVNPQGIDNINTVQLAVWSAIDNQDDLRWYDAERNGNVWSVEVDPANHYLDKGHYYIHIYAYNAAGETAFVGAMTPVVDFNGKLGFVEENGATYYYKSLGEKALGFERIKGERYFFDRTTGEMAVGWKYVDGFKYYFDEEGKMSQDVDQMIGLQSSYILKINAATNVATMYAFDPATGTYCIPVKAMRVSTGDDTPMGTYRLGQTFRWLLMFNGTYCQYLSLITGDFLLHSITYETTDIYTLQTIGYNRIGVNKSAGCVRFRCGEAYWIYTLVNSGHLRQVSLYRDYREVAPFDQPYYAPIPDNQTWDPTDPAITGKWDLY